MRYKDRVEKQRVRIISNKSNARESGKALFLPGTIAGVDLPLFEPSCLT